MWNWLGITNDPKIPEEGETKGESSESTESQENLTTENGDTTQPQGAEKKMVDVAANLSSYLYTFADKATKTATKLKESVDQRLEQTIVGDFSRENEKFIHERDQRRVGDAVPPWVGFHEEAVMKSQILALSADERNFLRDPPSGVDFQFNLEHMMPVALAVLKDDEELERMRFTLVPKRIKEDRFWRNYFYRVSLIKQSTQLSSLSLNKDPRSRSSESLNKSSDKSDSSPTTQQDTSQQIQQHDEPIHTEDVAGSPTTNEFASDAFDDNAHLSEEEMTQMLGGLNDKTEGEGTTTTTSNDNDWELDKELQEELESFELVNDDGTKGESDDDEDNEWQKEIEDLLDEDNENETKKT